MLPRAPRHWLVAVLATSLAALPVCAQSAEEEEKPVVKDNVTVTAKPSPAKVEVDRDVRSLPVNAAVLYDPAGEAVNAREPGEIVRVFPGMDFVFYGQGGIPSGPSVRGYTDRNFGQDMAGFLDGMPLNLFGFVASHGALDLTVLHSQAIERVELIRGPFNARYGDFHRGGSLNFVTRSRVAGPSVEAAGGSFGTFRGTVTFAVDRSRLPFFTMLEGYRTESYSRNSDLYRLNSFSKISVPLRESDTLSFAASLFKSEWDAPSYLDLAQIRSGAVSDKDVINPTDGGNSDVQLLYAIYTGARGWHATVHALHRDWDRWRHDQLISPSTQQLHQSDDRLVFGTRIEKNFEGMLYARPALLLAGVTGQRDDVSTRQERTVLRNVVSVVDDIDELLTQSAVYVQGQILPTDWLKVTAGVRYNHVDYDLDNQRLTADRYVQNYSASRVSPNIGVALQPLAGLVVYANAGSGMRSPTPRTEVHNSINSLERVEIARTRSYEVGIAYRPLRRIELQADVYRADNTNEIRSIPPGLQFESLGRSRRRGAEFDATWFSTDNRTRIYTSMSWVEARLTTPTNPAATHLPDVSPYVHRIGFEHVVDVASSKLILTGDWSWLGAKDLNTTGTIRSEPYQRATARLTYLAEGGRYRTWIGGFGYPASRYGESAFLFGSRVGVRANPRTNFEAGVARSF